MRIELDEQAIKHKIGARVDRAQLALDEAVAADSNYFCPEDTGDLIQSVFPVEGNGTLEWNAPYAKKQYYEAPNKSHDKNPNASPKWFEQAKARFIEKWRKIANEAYSG